MKNILLISVLLLTFTFAISQLVMKNYATNISNEKYTVLKRYDKFEIREYPEMFVAKTKLKSKQL